MIAVRLKQIGLIRKSYNKIFAVMQAYAPKLRARISYYAAYGRSCDLQNPQTLSEKLLWLSLNTYRNNSLILKCSDKYLVREYLAEQGCCDILNDLYYVWTTPEQIDFTILPSKFALKLSLGCTTNIICSDKSKLDLAEVKVQLRNWHKRQTIYNQMMAAVGGIKRKDLPRYFICEKYLGTENGAVPIDYKIYCFNGVPKAILVIGDRFNGKKSVFMTLDWIYLSKLDDNYQMPAVQFERPKSLGKMIQVAEKLSKPFPFVRVDFYDISGKTIFGELTFFPNGCVHMQETEIDGVSMGDLLDISKEINKY